LGQLESNEVVTYLVSSLTAELAKTIGPECGILVAFCIGRRRETQKEPRTVLVTFANRAQRLRVLFTRKELPY
jgi:hypothetical protein